MLTVYGLKNCDTCRKALKWLDGEGIAYTFHDVRKDGLGKADVERFIAAAGLDAVLNKRGTTWRGLDAARQARAETDAAALIAEHPALMKRPVFDDGRRLIVGFGVVQQKALADLAA